MDRGRGTMETTVARVRGESKLNEIYSGRTISSY